MKAENGNARGQRSQGSLSVGAPKTKAYALAFFDTAAAADSREPLLPPWGRDGAHGATAGGGFGVREAAPALHAPNMQQSPNSMAGACADRPTRSKPAAVIVCAFRAQGVGLAAHHKDEAGDGVYNQCYEKRQAQVKSLHAQLAFELPILQRARARNAAERRAAGSAKAAAKFAQSGGGGGGGGGGRQGAEPSKKRQFMDAGQLERRTLGNSGLKVFRMGSKSSLSSHSGVCPIAAHARGTPATERTALY